MRRELLEPDNSTFRSEKKEAQKKRKRFYNFRKLIQESNYQELSDYLQEVDSDELFKLKLAIDQVTS